MIKDASAMCQQNPPISLFFDVYAQTPYAYAFLQFLRIMDGIIWNNNFSSLFQAGTSQNCHIFLHIRKAFPGLLKMGTVPEGLDTRSREAYKQRNRETEKRQTEEQKNRKRKIEQQRNKKGLRVKKGELTSGSVREMFDNIWVFGSVDRGFEVCKLLVSLAKLFVLLWKQVEASGRTGVDLHSLSLSF